MNRKWSVTKLKGISSSTNVFGRCRENIAVDRNKSLRADYSVGGLLYSQLAESRGVSTYLSVRYLLDEIHNNVYLNDKIY